ncbi:MAG: class I SAM-dependent methyltransferase [Lachnospiraceae bacterium]|nr:class I SAM-dependent methyltransferase [Lachnospiraceae bacterium]
MRQKQQAEEWDALLCIKTTGRDDSISNQVNFPYEPTDYPVLERLANAGWIRKNNCLLDYGCGKGRVGFFLSYQTRCRSIGVDYDQRLILCAEENKETAVSGNRTDFVCENAVNHRIPPEVDRIYFFNPFSVEVLESVLLKISDSYYGNPREMLLFFYYPSDEYAASLMLEDTLNFVDEISCEDLFGTGDGRERIMIFQVGGM